jgi:hypothetical protein
MDTLGMAARAQITNSGTVILRSASKSALSISKSRRGEIPITDDVEIRRNLVGTPLPLEVEPGRRPNFPIAT